MPRLVPYWYQQEANEAIQTALINAGNVNPVAAIVTGGGKALLIAMAIETIIQREPRARVMALAPSMELVAQNIDEAIKFWSPGLVSRLGVYCAGLRMKDRQSQVIYGSPQSVAKQVARFGRIDYVFVDEAHTFDTTTKTGKLIVEGFKANNPNVIFIGLTATDYRMKGLKIVPLTQCGLFNSRVYDLTTGRNFNRLVREGVIASIVAPTIRFPQIDTDGIKIKGGDFDETELAKRAMQVTRQCVQIALDHAQERKYFMWFAVTIEHARMIHNVLTELAESAVIIHGDLEKKERIEGIDAYLAKSHRHIVSVAMLTTGFNAKFVDTLIVLRPTKSLPLFRQIIGRGFRVYPGKINFLVLDAGGNFARHKAINAPVDVGDSRAGLWGCSKEHVVAPLEAGRRSVSASSREKSSIRFPVNNPTQKETDLRVVLKLMEAEMPACGYLNDAEHLICRQCGRPRQGFLATRLKREISERNMLGDSDSYELHDESAVVLRDELCRETRVLEVRDMRVSPADNSVLTFDYETDAGHYAIRLDFERTAANNKFYAQARKFFEAATGRKVPNEAYRVVLQRELIPKPIDITLTKYEDGRVFMTEIRFLHERNLRSFRYDPTY